MLALFPPRLILNAARRRIACSNGSHSRDPGSIASMLYHDPVYSLKLTHSIDLLAIEIYAVVAGLSVEAFCRLVDGALAEKSAAISARTQCEEVEARLADREVQLKLTRDSEARFQAPFAHPPVAIPPTPPHPKSPPAHRPPSPTP